MRVLVIAAHMDDEAVGVGGTIVRHVRAGDQVTVCVVCKRAYDHRFDEAAIAIERQATKDAAARLGYTDLRFLELRDELLDERLLDVIVPIEQIVNDVRPATVYTHHRGDANQDHRAVFQASMVACRSIAPNPPDRILCYEVASSSDQAAPFPEFAFQPNTYVNVAGELPVKLAAVECYRRELREFPHPRSVRGLEVLARKRGMEAGLEAAEAFMLVRSVLR